MSALPPGENVEIARQVSRPSTARRLPLRVLTLLQCDTLRPADDQPWLSLVSLLQSDPHMHSANHGRNSCLHYFAHHGKASYCALALARGADPNARNSAGDTSLHMAARRGGSACTAAAAVLVSRGADIEAEGFAGERALLSAVRRGHLSLVDLLLENGADVSALREGVDGSVRSALFFAISRGDPVLARRLVEAGACPKTDGSRAPTLSELARSDNMVSQCLSAIGVNLEAGA